MRTDQLDQRLPCQQCGKLMGKAEARTGTCFWCQRIAAANAEARGYRSPR